ncbi:MAG: AAA family ATPase [Bifidobacteriaceae bacterium]|jgi:DNA helicase IV|nr:AAA family ATPase [Bifidobacteriaceae bacterium]
MSNLSSEISSEQEVVTQLYFRLDEIKDIVKKQLEKQRAKNIGGTHQDRLERNELVALQEDRLTKLNSVENNLVFGRLDFVTDEPTHYIGRIGLTDDNRNSILTDWRAPVAIGYYRATALEPHGIAMRRHINTKFRKVVSIDDEVFDLEAVGQTYDKEKSLAGDGALMNSLASQRTGHMADIVSTIQSEQDEIIRDSIDGVLVVQGGPGTGKTAVALHRAAYLLYSNREQLEKNGILVIGPSNTFLQYINEVLPSLGETGVVSTTISGLLREFTITMEDNHTAQIIKGNSNMTGVIGNALIFSREIPDSSTFFTLDQYKIELTPKDIEDAFDAVDKHGLTYNKGRAFFVKVILNHLAEKYINQVNEDFRKEFQNESIMEGKEDKLQIIKDLSGLEQVKIALNTAWKPLTPTSLLKKLYTDKSFLEICAPYLNDNELNAMMKSEKEIDNWSSHDIALLDEAISQIGIETVSKKFDEKRRAQQLARDAQYAKETMEALGIKTIQSASDIAERMSDTNENLTLSERAAADISWMYGHIVVDEAQELSDMEWRMLSRRSVNHSFTIVGDIAQTTSISGTRSWSKAFENIFENNFRISYLTVNYRNPRKIAHMANTFAQYHGLIDNNVIAPRELGDSLRVYEVESEELYKKSADEITRLLDEFVTDDGLGRIAVLVASEKMELVKSTFEKEMMSRGKEAELKRLHSKEGSDMQLEIVDPRETKGLEFDATVLIEPSDFLPEEENDMLHRINLSNLYVALSRSTNRLTIVHNKDLPKGLDIPYSDSDKNDKK